MTPEEDYRSRSSRIVFVFHRGDVVGGASIYIVHMARALAAEGHGVHVIIAGEGHFADLLARSGLSWSAIPAAGRAMGLSTALRAFRLVPALRAELERLRPTLVSAQGAQAAMFVRLLRRDLDCPVIHTPHGWSFMPGSGPRNQVFGRLAELALRDRADATIAVSAYEAEVGRRSRAVPPERQHVVLNGIPDLAPDPVDREEPVADDGVVTFVSVARFERQKNHTALVEAAHRIRDLPFRIDLFGEGDLESSVRDHVMRLDLTRRVRIRGTTDNIAGELRRAHGFVLSSRWESFPLSILEAMSAQRAIIATDVGGVAEAIDHGRNGLLVPADDVDALADALRSVIEDDGLRARLAAQARDDFESRFRLEAMTGPTIDLYRRVEADASPA